MLKGEKIYLRSVEKKDVSILFDMCSDREIRKYDGGNVVLPSIDFVMNNFDEVFNGNRKCLTIINQKGNAVGYISYSEFKDCVNVYSIGITIGKQFWGRGYAKDSINTLIEYLFMYKGAHRIELEVVEYNERAINCYKRCGFIKEGIKRNKYFAQGDYHNTVIMGILKNEYDNSKMSKTNN